MAFDRDCPFRAFDLSRAGTVVAAVSGGSDSLALLHLLLRHVRALPRPPGLLAVTVDHGLRSGSREEADAVAAICRALGVPHRIMRWEGDKPARGVMAAARTARYDLLAEAAEEAGGGIVATGHTMDDQAETVAMRAARGEGAGLAGMAPATLYDDRVWIVRPLLGLRRRDLRAMLGDLGIAWADDPSNDNPAYERVRMRALLDDRTVEELSGRAAAAGRERLAVARDAARLVERCLARPSPGLFSLPRDFFATEGTGGAALLVLRAVTAVAGGAEHLPDEARARALALRLADGEPLRATLSRALIDARKAGIHVLREARDVPRMPLSSRPVLWDGRWRIGAAGGMTVGPLGPDHGGGAAASTLAPQSLAKASLSLEPALYFNGQRRVLVAGARDGAGEVMAMPALGPWARFLPGFDLPLAQALRRLLDLPPLPGSPWKQHIGDQA